jgi:hypothetical protein
MVGYASTKANKVISMNLPSIKTLNSAFPGLGKDLRRALELSRKELKEHPASKHLSALFHPAKTSQIRLTVLDAIAETCGVEYVAHKDDTIFENKGFDYLNVGDPYIPTIIRFCETGRYVVACYGDIVEKGNYI